MKFYILLLVMYLGLSTFACGQLFEQHFIFKGKTEIRNYYNSKTAYKLRVDQSKGEVNSIWYGYNSINLGYFFDDNNICIGFVFIVRSTPDERDYLNTNYILKKDYWIDARKLIHDNLEWNVIWEIKYLSERGVQFTEFKATTLPK